MVPCEIQATGPTTTEPTACDAVQVQVPVPVETAIFPPSRKKRVKKKAGKRADKGKLAQRVKSTEVVSLSSDEALELNADSPLE